MFYDEIKERLSGIQEEWELCKGCEHLVDNGKSVTCKDKLPMKFTAIGSRTWEKSAPAKPLENCKRRVEFLVLHNEKDRFETRDFEKCRRCKNFRNFTGYEDLLDKGRISHDNGEVYTCLCAPDFFICLHSTKNHLLTSVLRDNANLKKRDKLWTFGQPKRKIRLWYSD